MSSDKENSVKKKSRCQVQNCTRDPNVSVHRLPKNDLLRRKWMKKLKLTKFCDPFYVCQLHFVQEDFCGASRRCLRAMAVPSVNLPNTNESVLQVSSEPSENVLKLPAGEPVLMESSLMESSLIESPIEDVTMFDSTNDRLDNTEYTAHNKQHRIDNTKFTISELKRRSKLKIKFT